MEHQKGQDWYIDVSSMSAYWKLGEEADVLCSDTPGDEGICLNFAKKGNVGGVAKMDWGGSRWLGVACNPSRIVWSYVIKGSYVANDAEVCDLSRFIKSVSISILFYK